MIAECKCQHCENPIEFEVAEFQETGRSERQIFGQSVPCPHCEKETIIYIDKPEPPGGWSKQAPVQTNPQPNPPAAKIKQYAQARWIIAGALVAIPILILIGYTLFQTSPKQAAETKSTNNPVEIKPEPKMTEVQRINTLTPKPFLMSAEEKNSRENILKALLEVQSATSVGVTRDRYGELLIKADAALNFEKIKLSTSRNERFLSCAENAISYYTKANSAWSEYFESDWLRENNLALMHRFDFDDLQKIGVVFDLADYSRSTHDNNIFHVPFQSCLSLYWKAADIYVEKMKDDASK